MKNLTHFIFLFCTAVSCHVFVQGVVAQESSEVLYERKRTILENTLPPSPEPASMVKYADVPFTHSLGLAEYQVPLYTLQGNELQIPIMLSYSSGGIKVDEIAGVAGLGWTLDAGGCVTREVVFLPDEYYSQQFGQMYDMPSASLLASLEAGVENTSTLSYLRSIYRKQKDSSPDRYSYSVCGLKGEFVITPSGDVVQLSGDGSLISYARSGNTIASFTITGPDGTAFVFSEQETGTKLSPLEEATIYSGEPANWTATTAWYLTSITSRSGAESAQFTYTASATWARTTPSRSWTISYTNGPAVGEVSTNSSNGFSLSSSTHSVKALSGITLKGYNVSFEYASGTGHMRHLTRFGEQNVSQNYPYMLRHVRVQNPAGQELAHYALTTGQDNLDGRIMLSGIRELHGTEESDYWNFAYWHPGKQISHYSQDWYGYFNGSSNDGWHHEEHHIGDPSPVYATDVCPFELVTSPLRSFRRAEHSRADGTEARYLSLKSANHNGATTEWEYEGNAIPISGGDSTSVGIRVRSITVKDGSTPVKTRSFSYSSPSSSEHVEPPYQDYITVNCVSKMITSGALPYEVKDWSWVLHEHPISDGGSLQDARIWYGQVMEEVSCADASQNGVAKTVYHYNTTPLVRGGYSTIDRFPSQWEDAYNYGPDVTMSPWIGVQSGYNPDGPARSALLTKKEIYRWDGSTSVLAEKEEYTYDSPSGVAVLIGYTVNRVIDRTYQNGNLPYSDLYHYPVWASGYVSPVVTSVTRTEYHQTGTTVTNVNYGYTPRTNFFNPVRILSRTLSGTDGTRIVQYTYPDTWSGDAPAWVDTLSSQHALTAPIKSTYIKNGMVDGHLVIDTSTETSTEYSFFNVNGGSRLLPSATYEYQDGILTWEEQILSRDNKGNVSSLKERGKPETVILWGYGGTCPVAVVENASMSQVISNLGTSFLNSLLVNPAGPTTSQQNQLRSLRTQMPSSHVSLYTHIPGVGITSLSEPSGQKHSFTYDTAGRLTRVSNHSNEKMMDITYNLRNDGSNHLSVRERNYLSSTGAYYDDVHWWNTLGLPQQDIAIGGGGDGSDVVTAYESDFLLHDKVQTWLPYPVTGSGGSFQSGAAETSAQYNGHAASYTATRYEISDRERVSGQADPGYAGSHESRVFYESKSFPFYVWEDGLGPRQRGTYPSSEIQAESAVDADGRKVTIVRNRFGHILAKELGYEQNIAESGLPTQTLFIYDRKGRLRSVCGSGISLSDTLSMWRYSYDGHGRLSSKGLPGSEREGYAYDAEDRMVLRVNTGGTWTYTHDAFGRTMQVYMTPSAGGSQVLMEEHLYDHYTTALRTLLHQDGLVPYSEIIDKPGLEIGSRYALVNGDGVVNGYVQRVLGYDPFDRTIHTLEVDADGSRIWTYTEYDFSGNPVLLRERVSHGANYDEVEHQLSYDGRSRMAGDICILRTNGNASVRDTTTHSYDAVGRLVSRTLSGGNGGMKEDLSYSLQGRLASKTVSLGGVPRYRETLLYDTPISAQVNGSYTGLVVEKDEEWNTRGRPSAYPYNSTIAEAYAYDYAGRLIQTGRKTGNALNLEPLPIGSLEGESYTYDHRGNIVEERGNQMLGYYQNIYDGDKLVMENRLLGMPNGMPIESLVFTYDARGRMTYDGKAWLYLHYNELDRIRKICNWNGVVLEENTYLADGTLRERVDSSGVGLVYLGSLIYRKGANGALSLESAPFGGGRLTPAGVRYHVTDHLGSVVAVSDGSNSVLETGRYQAYGNFTSPAFTGGAVPGSIETPNRYRFTGKEDLSVEFNVPYTDFGARHYSPALRRWTTLDPMSEKYYTTSPYVYCNDNPVNLVDVDGRKWLNPSLIEYLKAQTTARIEYLGKESNMNNDRNEQIAYLYQSLSDIELLENDTEHYYALTYNWGEKNYVRRGTGGIILIDTYSDGISLHEIHHVAQSLTAGGLEFSDGGFLKNAALNHGNGNRVGLQLYEAIALQEIEAYQIQFSMDGVVPISGAETLKDINIESVGSLVDDNGESVYPAIRRLLEHLKKISLYRK